MNIALILGVIAALASGIWFLVIAFKENVWWGFGCLLVPFAAIVFVILNFSKAWLPFAINLIASFVIVSSILSSMPSEGGLDSITQTQLELQQKVERGEITEEQAEAETRRMLESIMSGKKYNPGQIKEPEVTAKTPVAPKVTEDTLEKAQESHRLAREEWNKKWKDRYKNTQQQKELGYKPFKLADAKQQLENNVRVTTRSGQVREGTLLNVMDDKLVVGKQTANGVFSYDIDKNQISELEVETWVVTPVPQ